MINQTNIEVEVIEVPSLDDLFEQPIPQGESIEVPCLDFLFQATEQATEIEAPEIF